jgi:ATP-dependent Clp protease ATP-binding subunit ClpA
MKNWTVNAMEALQKAQQKAFGASHAEIAPLHLLWALLSEPGVASSTLHSLETDPQLVLRTVDQELASLPRSARREAPDAGRELQTSMLEAQALAQKRSGGMVGTRELLLALAADRGRAGSVLRTFDLTAAKLARRSSRPPPAATTGRTRAAGPTARNRPCASTPATSATSPARARSTPSSAATRRSAAWCRSSAAAPRTTPC